MTEVTQIVIKSLLFKVINCHIYILIILCNFVDFIYGKNEKYILKH